MPDSLGRFQKGEHWRPRKPHWGKEWLLHHYVELGLSTGEISVQVGCTDAAIIHWLKVHDIPRRTVSEARAIKRWGSVGTANPMYGRTGKANPRYVDGSSPERQRLYAQWFGRFFVLSVLERDGHRCRRCSASKTVSRSIHVHHIKPWAGNPELRFDVDNAVTLCRSCHSWVHSKANIAQEYLG